MEREELYQAIKRLLVNQFDVDEQRITAGALLYDELDFDSIDAVDLMVQLKELTGKKISPEDFQDVRTIGDVLDRLTSA